MKWNEFEKEILSNADTAEEYARLQPEYDLIKVVLDARKEKQMTQQELADKVGLNRSEISKIENGNANPSYKMLQRIAAGLGMKVKLEFVNE